jgi:hypothetical protein
MKGNKPKPPVPGPVRRSPPKTLKKGTGNKGKTKDTGKKKKNGQQGQEGIHGIVVVVVTTQ